jgi:hypothetical protein
MLASLKNFHVNWPLYIEKGPGQDLVIGKDDLGAAIESLGDIKGA